MSFEAHRDILFLDIETVSQFHHYQDLANQNQSLAEHWTKKAKNLKNEHQLGESELYFDRAGIFAEFGKIVCIGLGFFNVKSEKVFKVKCLQNTDEKELLLAFKSILEKLRSPRLCAHNGKEFDFPYLCRRMLINGISLPAALDIQNKKPWEITHLDTLDMWKFGDYKHYTGLDLLAACFGLKSSKDDISGDQVNTVFYNENDLERIAEYCQKDVVVLAQLYLKMKAEEAFSTDQVEWA